MYIIPVAAPPHFEIKLKNQTARRGEPAVLQCEAQGEKPIGILWNMNNKRLDPKSDSRYTIREEILANGVLSDLSIKRTERSDSALFTCVATNAFGSDDTSINMIVQGSNWFAQKSNVHLAFRIFAMGNMINSLLETMFRNHEQ